MYFVAGPRCLTAVRRSQIGRMKITVILCTFNRCRKLVGALESIAAIVMPDSSRWEVLIVDNNSDDRTHEVIEMFCQRYPGRFRYLFEPNQGKSFALNRGIREADGDIFAFIDDDVVVEPNWLLELTKPLADSRWIGTGGRVYLPKDFTPPSWLAIEGKQSLASILAQFDLGSEVRELTRPPIGNNMAFRKEVFERFGGFRTDLGPKPGSEIRCEDTELGSRVMKGGGKVLYVPTAVVHHEIDEDRVSKPYFLAYHFDYGRALIREREKRNAIGIVPRSFISLSNRCLNILPRRTWWWVRELDPQRRFINKCRVWTTAGEIAEICRDVLAGSEGIPRTDWKS
jgi:glycosyltransferase involved in cell wall biosynthesis